MQIIVLGGGIVGLTVANLLALNPELNIILIESKPAIFEWDNAGYDLRVSAITRASQNVLDHIGVWRAILNNRAAFYTKMQVWQQHTNLQVEFTAASINEDNLGHIIENRVLQAELYKALLPRNNVKIINSSATQLRIEQASNHILVDEQWFEAKLVIGADGANSWLRNMAKLEVYQRSYGQHALVATIQSEFIHGKVARQVFTPDGPLAFLPFSDLNTSSIVWSAAAEKIAYLQALPEQEFCIELANEFEQRLGKLTLLGTRATFPLTMLHADKYIGSRLALIGDAAHVIHPLAGQGLNLGILDAASLTEVVMKAHQQQQDIGTAKVLRKYERWRKGQNANMLILMEWIKNISMQQYGTLTKLREIGIQGLNQLQWLKNFMMRVALGISADLPQYANQQQGLE